MSVKPLVAGNWKMNGLKASVAEFEAIAAGYDAALKAKAELAICPPFTLVLPDPERAAPMMIARAVMPAKLPAARASTQSLR